MMDDDLTGLLEGELGQSVLDMAADENENLSDYDVDLDDEAATSALKAAKKRGKKELSRPNLSELRSRFSPLNIADLAESKERRTGSEDSGISCEHSPISNGNGAISRIPSGINPEASSGEETIVAARAASQELESQESAEDHYGPQWERAIKRRRRRAASQSNGEEGPFTKSADSATSKASIDNVFAKLRVKADTEPKPALVFANLGVDVEPQAGPAEQPFPSPSTRLGYYSTEKIREIREELGDVEMDYSRYTDVHEEFLSQLKPGAHVPRAPRVKKPWNERRNDPMENKRKEWNTFTDSNKYKNDRIWKNEWKQEFETRGNNVPPFLTKPDPETDENNETFQSPEDWTTQRRENRKNAGLEAALQVNHENHDENSEWNVNGDATSVSSEPNIVMSAPPGFENAHARLQGTAPPGLAPPPGLLSAPPGLEPPGLPPRNGHCDRSQDSRSYRSGNDSQESNYVERRYSHDEDNGSGFGQRDFNAMDRRMEKEERHQSRRFYERELDEREERERESRRYSDEGSSGAGHSRHYDEGRNNSYHSPPRSSNYSQDTKFTRPFGDPNSSNNASRSSNNYENTKFSRPSGERPASRPNSYHHSPPRSNNYEDTKFRRPSGDSRLNCHHSPPRSNNYEDTEYARVGYSREQREEYPRSSRDYQEESRERTNFPSSVASRTRLDSYESTTERDVPSAGRQQQRIASESEQMNESFLSADNRSFNERSPVKPVKVDPRQKPSTSRTILDAVDEQRSSHRSRTSISEQRASHSNKEHNSHTYEESSTRSVRNSAAPSVAPLPEASEPEISHEDQVKLWREDVLRPIRARFYRNGEPIFPYLTKIYGTEIPEDTLRQPSETTTWVQAEMAGKKLEQVPHLYDPETDTATGYVPYVLKEMYHDGKIKPHSLIAMGIEDKKFSSQEDFLNKPMIGFARVHPPFNSALDCLRKENELKIKAIRYRERVRDLKFLMEQYETAKARGEAQ